MGSHQGTQGGAAILHGSQPSGVGLDTLGVPRTLGRHVTDEDGDLAQPVGERRELGVVMPDGVQAPACGAQQRGGIGVADRGTGVPAQGRVGQRRSRLQLLGMAEALRLGPQLDVLHGLGSTRSTSARPRRSSSASCTRARACER